MNIAIEVSALEKEQHRVRGTGIYTKNLINSLKKYYPEHEYIFFTQGDNIPRDVDIVHYSYFEPFFITIPFFKLHKTIVTIHDLIPFVFPKHFPSGIKGKVKWEIQKILLKKVDAIITDSFCSKKDIIKHTGISENKIHVVYLAVSKEFRKLSEEELRQKAKIVKKKYALPGKFILYVGDVTWNKNLPQLIQAATKSRIPLVLVGNALVKKNFDKFNLWNQDLVKIYNLSEDNEFIKRLGFVPTEDLVCLYNMATVFAMPSLYEGFGLPLLEAMSCGCPVVTTRGGSIPEVAGDAAIYVETNSGDDIAHSIYNVFQKEKIQRDLSERGLMQAQKFTWKKTIEGTMRVYEKNN